MDLATTLAAPKALTVDGQTYRFSRLTLRDFGELEQAALDAYRREYLQTRLGNADLIAGDMPFEQYRAKVIEEALRLRLDNLPPVGTEMPVFDEDMQPIFDDDGNPRMRRQLVEYPIYWFTQTTSGRLHAVYLSLKKEHPEITIDKVDRLMMEFAGKGYSAEMIANMIGEISSPSGNSSQPPEQEAPAATQTPAPERGPVSSEKSARRTRRRRKKSKT